MTAKLYGIGTGPGDPELMTRKAWRIITEAQVIAYPSAAHPSGECLGSFARTIVQDAIAKNTIEIEMPVPMVSGRAPAQAIYDKGAKAIMEHLSRGQSVVVLCEGDPLFYGSFMYILARLRGSVPVEIIPGVTSMTACAAAQCQALVARNDALMVVPATLDDSVLTQRIACAEAVVIMKLGRHLPRIRALLEALGLVGSAQYISHASLPHQQVLPLMEAPADAPYFSMIIIYKGDDPWI